MNEAEQVQEMFKKKLKIDLHYAKVEKEFLDALQGVSDPEQKRKIIGRTFIRVFERSARDLMKKRGEFDFLAQGTLYPDVIESVSVKGPSATIKSHHNVGGLPEDMKFKLVEPLRELFKDEVRALGAKLGIPKEMLWRQPFPGPGLAVRVVGEITAGKAGNPSQGRRHRDGRNPKGRPLLFHLAVLRGTDSHQDGRGHGGRAHLRPCLRHPGGPFHRWHDRRLGETAL